MVYVLYLFVAGVQELLLCDDTPGPPDARVLKTSLKAAATGSTTRFQHLFTVSWSF